MAFIPLLLTIIVIGLLEIVRYRIWTRDRRSNTSRPHVLPIGSLRKTRAGRWALVGIMPSLAVLCGLLGDLAYRNGVGTAFLEGMLVLAVLAFALFFYLAIRGGG